MDLQLAIISVVLLGLRFFAAPSAGCEWYNMKDFALPAFKDKSVSDFVLSTTPGTEKLLMCAVKCRFDIRCISFQFNHLTNTCSLFGCGLSRPEKTFQQVTEETGWQLYRMLGRDHSFGHDCSTSDNCDFANSYCRDGRCECVLGFSYNPNTGICVTRCDAYGSTFETEHYVAINGHNRDVLYETTVQKCVQACLDASAYVCRSCEFHTSVATCKLSGHSWLDVDNSDREYQSTGWLLMSRNCAVTRRN